VADQAEVAEPEQLVVMAVPAKPQEQEAMGYLHQYLAQV
jgi:hypothetical protein